MLQQERSCFAETLQVDLEQIRPFDLLVQIPTASDLLEADIILIGGSGKYSATAQAPWLERSLQLLREICQQGQPMFASCWGFQALSRALGGRVVHDLPNAELGTLQLRLTPAGEEDPLFGALGSTFTAQAGHEDHVVELPAGAVLLASSERVAEQAFRWRDLPIYATQFHPELTRERLLQRLRAYPEYVERIYGQTLAEFEQHCHDTPAASSLLRRFVEQVFPDRQ